MEEQDDLFRIKDENVELVEFVKDEKKQEQKIITHTPSQPRERVNRQPKQNIEKVLHDNNENLINVVDEKLIQFGNMLVQVHEQINTINLKISEYEVINNENNNDMQINFNAEQHSEFTNEALQDMPIDKLMFLYYMLTGKTIRKTKKEIIDNIKAVLH